MIDINVSSHGYAHYDLMLAESPVFCYQTVMEYPTKRS